MARSHLTRKGQATIPKIVRDHLKLRPGDALEFVVRPDGQVVLRPASTDVRNLRGALAGAGRRRRLTIEEMNALVRRRGARGK
jgi:AbrB family looped-hinge helix DNA binding protein